MAHIIKISQDKELDDHRLAAYDWSTEMAQLVVAREEWRCCTTGDGVQFVTILGNTMMPGLLAGTILISCTQILLSPHPGP